MFCVGCILGILFFVMFKFVKPTFGILFVMGISAVCAVIILRKVVRLLWACLCMGLVINFDMTFNHNGHLGGAGGFMISFYDMILFSLYFLWIVDFIVKKKVTIDFYPRISIPAVLLFITIFISTLDTLYVNLSIFEFVEVFKFYLTFLYLSNNIKEKKDVSFFIFFLVLGLLLESILGILQHKYDAPITPTIIGSKSFILNSRIVGTWLSYNDFSFYLTYFMPLAFVCIFTKVPILFRYIYGFAFLLSVPAIIWTNSRGAWLSLALAMFFVFMFMTSHIRGKQAVIKTFLTILVVIVLVSPIFPRVIDKVVGRVVNDDNGSAESRLPQFEVAGNIIRANPINGIGLNNYTEVMLDYDTTEEGLFSITRYPVHNVYLHMFAELGIIGIMSYAFLIISIFRVGLKYTSTYKDDNSFYIIGLLAGIISFLFHGTVDTVSLGNKLFIYLWFFTGLIVAFVRIKKNALNDAAEQRQNVAYAINRR